MDQSDVIEKLVEIHKNDQAEAGQDDAAQVTATSAPLSDLKGFDSLLIPGIIRRLARELGHPLPKGTRIKNIYVLQSKKLTIAEIAGRFIEEYMPEGSSK